MQFEPRNDYVLVQTDPKQTKTKQGILLSEGSQEDSQEATVLAVGPGHFTFSGDRVAIDLKPKDRVLIAQFAGQAVGDDKDRLFLVRQDSIICKLFKD